MKKIDVFVLGMVQVNTYLLWQDNHVLIVDPGSKSPKLQEAIDSCEGIVDGILLTHAHFDHIAGVDALASKYKCPLYLNDLEIPMLTDAHLNFSSGMQDVIVKTKPIGLGQGMHTIGAFEFEFIDAPGHSEGSSMIRWGNDLFCGDVLFQGSIGRTDLPTSSNSKMMQSLKMIKMMDPTLVVYPGHGPSTTLQEELMSNPFLQF